MPSVFHEYSHQQTLTHLAVQVVRCHASSADAGAARPEVDDDGLCKGWIFMRGGTQSQPLLHLQSDPTGQTTGHRQVALDGDSDSDGDNPFTISRVAGALDTAMRSFLVRMLLCWIFTIIADLVLRSQTLNIQCHVTLLALVLGSQGRRRFHNYRSVNEDAAVDSASEAAALGRLSQCCCTGIRFAAGRPGEKSSPHFVLSFTGRGALIWVCWPARSVDCCRYCEDFCVPSVITLIERMNLLLPGLGATQCVRMVTMIVGTVRGMLPSACLDMSMQHERRLAIFPAPSALVLAETLFPLYEAKHRQFLRPRITNAASCSSNVAQLILKDLESLHHQLCQDMLSGSTTTQEELAHWTGVTLPAACTRIMTDYACHVAWPWHTDYHGIAHPTTNRVIKATQDVSTGEPPTPTGWSDRTWQALCGMFRSAVQLGAQASALSHAVTVADDPAWIGRCFCVCDHVVVVGARADGGPAPTGTTMLELPRIVPAGTCAALEICAETWAMRPCEVQWRGGRASLCASAPAVAAVVASAHFPAVVRVVSCGKGALDLHVPQRGSIQVELSAIAPWRGTNHLSTDQVSIKAQGLSGLHVEPRAAVLPAVVTLSMTDDSTGTGALVIDGNTVVRQQIVLCCSSQL
eukprot:COSAG01_NODE_1312_length_10767_cov_25.248969_8_plen_634_part_00